MFKVRLQPFPSLVPAGIRNQKDETLCGSFSDCGSENSGTETVSPAGEETEAVVGAEAAVAAAWAGNVCSRAKSARMGTVRRNKCFFLIK